MKLCISALIIALLTACGGEQSTSQTSENTTTVFWDSVYFSDGSPAQSYRILYGGKGKALNRVGVPMGSTQWQLSTVLGSEVEVIIEAYDTNGNSVFFSPAKVTP